MMEIIDFHMHPYLSGKEFSCMYPEVFSPSPGQMKEDVTRAGISHVCGSVIEVGKYTKEEGFAHLKKLNRKALQLKEILGDFYTPGFHVHPDHVKESCEEIDLMHEKGVKLIGELVPYMHGWRDYSNKGLSEILDYAEQYNMVVSYHTMTEEQEEMDRMVAAHPGLTFVAAHPGERGFYEKHLERMEKYDNLYLDLSGTGIFRYGNIAYGISRVGADRFLFGTDYPICNPGMYVHAVLHEQMTEEERQKILYGNAARILGMNCKRGNR